MQILPPKQAAVLKEEPAAVLFSAGKDSIAAADILHRENLLPKDFIFLYFVPGLSFVESILRHYEKKWKVNIIRRPSDEALSLFSAMRNVRKKQYTESDAMALIRAEFDNVWLISGAKKKDSLARRGMLSKLVDGVDSKRKTIYPIIEWSDRQVNAYCKKNRLKLPITYDMGLKNSMWVPNTEGLVWIKSNFPKDYDRIVRFFPNLESLVFKYKRQYARE